MSVLTHGPLVEYIIHPTLCFSFIFLAHLELCHGLLSVCRPSLAFHIFDISRTISWIVLKLRPHSHYILNPDQSDTDQVGPDQIDPLQIAFTLGLI